MRTSIALLLALTACSDDEPTADAYKCAAAGGAGCFELPTRVVEATDATGAPTAPVLDCSAYEVTTAGAPVTFTGNTVHAVNKAKIGLVHVELFSDLALTTLLAETISDEMGAYTLTVDALPSQVFVRTMGADTLPVHKLYERFDVSVTQHDMHDFITTTRNAVVGILDSVGDLFMTGKTQLTGYAYDCNGNRLVNVVANIAQSSAAAGERLYEPGVRVYYYAIDTQDALYLARRAQSAMTNSPGSFLATNLATGKHYVQVWGYPDDAALDNGAEGLVLLGEAEIRVPGMETATFVSVHSRR
jgi:hypothetical protein